MQKSRDYLLSLAKEMQKKLKDEKNYDELEKAMNDLQQEMQKIGEVIYKAQQTGNNQSNNVSEHSNESDDSNIVDAEVVE